MSGREIPRVGVPMETPSINTFTLLIGEPSVGSAIQPLTMRLSQELTAVFPLTLLTAFSSAPKDPDVTLTLTGPRVVDTAWESVPTTVTTWVPADRLVG